MLYSLRTIRLLARLQLVFGFTSFGEKTSVSAVGTMTAVFLLTTVWLCVLGNVASQPNPLVEAPPCKHVQPYTRACDYATGGHSFFWCVSREGFGLGYRIDCLHNLVFDNKLQVCVWPWDTICSEPTTTTTTTTTTTSAPTTTTTATSGGITSTAANVPTTDQTTPSSTSTTTLPTTTTTMVPLPEGTCNSTTCPPPDCRCMGTDIPGNLTPEEVPQMVLLTFDDSVNANNIHYYEDLLPADEVKATRNPNGCRTAATFFVSGQWTNMTMVKELAERGNEMASHSQTHSSPASPKWDRPTWKEEMQGMREQLAQGTGMNQTEIGGSRTPFLILGREEQFSMLQDAGFLYDSSMYGGNLTQDSSQVTWPFTVKYPPASSQLMCDQAYCPKGSYPKVWEVPLIRQYSLTGVPCSMTDSCPFAKNATKEDVKDFLYHNFNRHYAVGKNRAPFMISLHATWFKNVQHSYEALKEFLMEISRRGDVYQVTITQMLDWVRNPQNLTRLSEIPSWQCSNPMTTTTAVPTDTTTAASGNITSTDAPTDTTTAASGDITSSAANVPTTNLTTPSSTDTTTVPTALTSESAGTTLAPFPEGTCNSSTCQLPDCRCMGTDIPGNLAPEKVPQMILLTFDDEVTANNFYYYEGLFPADRTTARMNPNNCSAAATFFVSGGWGLNMTMVKMLADRGNEVASHSQTQSSPSTWDRPTWKEEIQGMREILAQGTGLNQTEIAGMRSPYFILGGDDQFSMLRDTGFLYDSSMYGGSLQQESSDIIWPFTLRYPPSPSQLMCDLATGCPERSYPQVWEVPIIRQYTLQGQACLTTDSCPFAAQDAIKEKVKAFLYENLNRHYNRNRAPFMVTLHATWFMQGHYRYEALKEFLQEISVLGDVYQVTITQMLDWVRNPLPLDRLSEIPSWQCP